MQIKLNHWITDKLTCRKKFDHARLLSAAVKTMAMFHGTFMWLLCYIM